MILSYKEVDKFYRRQLIDVPKVGACYIKPDTLNARIRSLEMVQPENRFASISPEETLGHLEAVIAGLDPVKVNLFMDKINNYGDLLDIFKRMQANLEQEVISVR